MSNNLTEGQKVLQKSINYYFEEMNKLHEEGFEDETGPDIEDWGAIESIVIDYINGGELDREGLLTYFGDPKRVELVVSFYNITKYLIENGATISI